MKTVQIENVVGEAVSHNPDIIKEGSVE